MSLARAGARAKALHTCISTVIGIQFYIAINTHVAQMYFYCYWDSILYSY